MWSIVIPVKRLSLAKSRLSTVFGPANSRVALAMASDTVGAALACASVATVLVVTDDQLAAGTLSAVGALVVPDAPDDGLNAALRYGSQAASALRPDDGVAALSADLAAMRPEELTAALHQAASHPRAFLADVETTGTTLLSALPGHNLEPRFGPDSALAHLRSGAHPLDGAWPGLRRDLDTPSDLSAAVRLGLGPATAAELAVLAPDLDCCAR